MASARSNSIAIHVAHEVLIKVGHPKNHDFVNMIGRVVGGRETGIRQPATSRAIKRNAQKRIAMFALRQPERIVTRSFLAEKP